MRKNVLVAPVLGLLGLAMVAAPLWSGCSDGDAGDDTAPLDPTPAVGTNPTGTFAGPAEDGDTYVAVLAGEGLLLVYACDGKSVSQWFQLQTQGLPAVARNAAGTTLEIGPSEKGLAGLVVSADEAWTLAFDVPEDAKAKLLRGSSGVDGTRVVGGWIRLGDGSQRGAITLTDKDGSTTLGSTVDESGAPIPVGNELPGTLTVEKLAPVAEALATFNSPFDFNVVGLGAPTAPARVRPRRPGTSARRRASTISRRSARATPSVRRRTVSRAASSTWTSASPPTACFEPVTWDATDPASKYCHRTPNSGIAQGVEKLRLAYPDIDVRFESFACTGAVANELASAVKTDCPNPKKDAICKDGLNQKFPTNKNWPYVDGLPLELPPQLQQVDEFLKKSEAACAMNVDQEAGWQTGIDAFVASIGGNHALFSTVLGAAMADIADPGVDNSIMNDAKEGIETLFAKYKAIRDRIAAAPTVAGRNLMPPPANFFLLEYPDLFSTGSSSDALCTGAELSKDKLGDDVLQNLSTLEVTDMSGLQPLLRNKQALVESDLSWTFVIGIAGRSRGHGACMERGVRYFNTNRDALVRQGNDLYGGAGIVYLSMGIMHPNALGHASMYRDPIFERLDAALKRKFRPMIPTQFRVVSYSVKDGSTFAELGWADNSSTRHSSSSRSPMGRC
ncbi:MAG: hypothetical protein FJ096_17505 [Deltaproteobacteria bacterium]|nr:hypothetical protein [Deltaproteobacteria bacterium]